MSNKRSTAEEERKKNDGRRRSAIDRNLSRLFSFFLIPYRATFFRNVPSLGCCVTVPHKDYISYVVRIANALPRPFCALRHSGLINVPLENWKDLAPPKETNANANASPAATYLPFSEHFRSTSDEKTSDMRSAESRTIIKHTPDLFTFYVSRLSCH